MRKPSTSHPSQRTQIVRHAAKLSQHDRVAEIAGGRITSPGAIPSLECRARCCNLVTPFLRESDKLVRAEGDRMFDVYLNEKRDRLLVVPKGQPIPNIGNSGRWRKKKGAVAVSDEIKLALQRDGFYWRRRAEHRGSNSLQS